MTNYIVNISSLLPSHGWGISWNRKCQQFHLLAGLSVATYKNYWVEGVWNGSFENFDFHNCYLAGSGGKITDSYLSLVPPFHTYECIYVLNKSNYTYASNSLAFCLELAQENLKPEYAFYCENLGEVVWGESNFSIKLIFD